MSNCKINFHMCFFCFDGTNTRENLAKLGVKFFEENKTEYFMPSNAVMGSCNCSIGIWIKHDNKDKLWFSKCIVPTSDSKDPTPACGAPRCVSCPKER